MKEKIKKQRNENMEMNFFKELSAIGNNLSNNKAQIRNSKQK